MLKNEMIRQIKPPLLFSLILSGKSHFLFREKRKVQKEKAADATFSFWSG